ncbi:MAG: prepilin-type N-terminal cleavage/methylation domain-containing protein [Ilumatobacteraceae bacterium]
MEVLDAPVETKKDKGFTLVELLIVIVILGILSTVTVFAVQGITDKGQASACTAETKTVQTAVETYFAQYGGTAIATAAYATYGVSPNIVPAGAVQAVPTMSDGTAVTWTAGATPATTLVNAGILKSLPKLVFVERNGVIRVNNTATYAGAGKCGTMGAILT